MARSWLALSLLLAWVPWTACSRNASFREAQAKWQAREPHAYAAWRAAAVHDEEARDRLARAARLYEDGVAALEAGSPLATDELRRGAEIAPIDPALYLRLARACRAQGAFVRATDFYRKRLVEEPGDRVARAELAQIDHEVGDPFVLPPTRDWRWAFLLVPLLALPLVRPRRIDVAAVLEAHPERAAAFAYQVGILRHEVMKHQLAPWRSGRTGDVEAAQRAWRRHVESVGLTLGLARGWWRREPAFAAAARAVEKLGRSELTAIDALERELVTWVRLARHTCVDGRLLDALVDSMHDERPGGLGVEVRVHATATPIAAIFEHDLLLVARNLVRNAIAATQDAQGKAVLVEVSLHVDDAAQEWVRIAVHDGNPGRPGRGEAGRGLGIVRATLERYGGALVDGAPAAGFEKALVASVPAAEESTSEAMLHARPLPRHAA